MVNLVALKSGTGDQDLEVKTESQLIELGSQGALISIYTGLLGNIFLNQLARIRIKL